LYRLTAPDPKLFIVLLLFASCAFAPAVHAQGAAAQGQALYATLCARCHGENLEHPQPNTPDLKNVKASQHDLFVTMVENGKGEMPPWKGLLSPAQIGQIWAYVQAHAK
jgi:mono/diheme cytochrome c family protein